MNEAEMKLNDIQAKLKKAEQELTNMQFELRYDLVTAEQVASAENSVAKLRSQYSQAVAEVKNAEKERDNAALSERFSKAVERAKDSAKESVEAVEALTDDDALLQNIVRGMAQNAVWQIVSTEGYYSRVSIRATRQYGLERSYDEREHVGESPDHGNTVVDQAERAIAQLEELDALAVALESKYYEIQDRRIKRGELGEDSAYPCFREGNVIDAVVATRTKDAKRQAQRREQWRLEQAQIAAGMPSVDAVVGHG